MEHAFLIIKRIFTAGGSLFFESTLVYAFLATFLLFLIEAKREYYKGSFSLFDNKNAWVRKLSYACMIILILSIGVFDGGQFIYFQF
jgi:hypothetical protein